MKISRFDNKTDIFPKPREMDWYELVNLVRAGSRAADKDHSEAICLSSFNGTRCQENAETSAGFVIDLDNKPENGPIVPLKEITKRLEERGVSWVAYPTWSHTKGAPRYRVIVPFLAPQPANCMRSIANWAVEHLHLGDCMHQIDKGAMRDGARLWFFGPPALTKEGTISKKGHPLEVPPEALKSPDLDWGCGLPAMAREGGGFAAAYLEGIPPASAGDRNNSLFKVACYLRDYGVEQEVALPHLMDWAYRSNPPLSESEAAECIRSAFAHAKGSPGSRTQRTIPDGTGRTFPIPAFQTPTPGTREYGNDPLEPFETLDMEEMLRSAPSPLEWLVPGLLPLGMAGILASSPGVGKSRMALEWACRVAAGLPVLGATPAAPGGVIFYSAEDNRESLKRRLHSVMPLLVADGLTDTVKREMLQNMRLHTPRGAAPLPVLAPWLANVARNLPVPTKMIVLDTFARVNGGKDENSAADCAAVLNAMGALQQETGACVLAIHHTHKGAGENGSMTLTQRLAMESIRGSSAIIGAARFTISIALLNEAEAARASLDAERTSAGAYAVVALSKCNEAERGRWMLMERIPRGESGEGYFRPHPDSEHLLASIRGAGAAEKMAVADAFLASVCRVGGDLHAPGFNRLSVAKEISPDNKNPANAASKALWKLRELGYLGEQFVTDLGWSRFRRMESGEAEPIAVEEGWL